YSNLYSPATRLRELAGTSGLLLESLGSSEAQVEQLLHSGAGLSAEDASKVVEAVPHGMIGGLSKQKAESLAAQLHALGAEAKVESLETHKWPKPYDELTNPLAINLTAFNTFVLICSSVTMVLALAAIQQGNKRKCSFFLLATIFIGSGFLSIQIYE